MGAEVTVVAGPQRAALPIQARVVRVRTAEEMLDAALSEAKDQDLVIGAAAVADYRLAEPVPGKLRRGEGALRLELLPNPDIIAAVAKAAPTARVVGFAAEPTADLAVAGAKLAKKGLWAIAANDVSQRGIGFDSDENVLNLLKADGNQETSGLRSKLGCALWLLEHLAGA
jgi:phosphopantothenoylcysteine decarboxylase/phosphopantothenate--cysteine ligase